MCGRSVLSQLTTPNTRSDVLAWYVTIPALGSSIGSEASGRIISFLQSKDGWTPVDAYHALFWLYGIMGVVNVLMVLGLSDACEMRSSNEAYAQVPQDESSASDGRTEPVIPMASVPDTRTWSSKARAWFVGSLTQISAPTRSTMYKLWFLLAVDSLADGMVPWSMTNYYLDTKFHPAKSTLGDLTSVSYFLTAIGAVFAGPLARKIGLINTMVFTHVPSSTAVLLTPFPPYLWMTAPLLFLRAGLNNMDQAPRVAFISAVVKPDERTAVMGITSMLRTLAAMAGPTITGFFAANDQFWMAFVGAGLFRLAYDFGLYAMFVNTKLYEHEAKPEGLAHAHSARRERDEEEMLEMQSLASSDEGLDIKDDESLISKTEVAGSNSALQLPGSRDRVRSRSPHRPNGH